jgi:hypothetical protein
MPGTVCTCGLTGTTACCTTDVDIHNQMAHQSDKKTDSIVSVPATTLLPGFRLTVTAEAFKTEDQLALQCRSTATP